MWKVRAHVRSAGSKRRDVGGAISATRVEGVEFGVDLTMGGTVVVDCNEREL